MSDETTPEQRTARARHLHSLPTLTRDETVELAALAYDDAVDDDLRASIRSSFEDPDDGLEVAAVRLDPIRPAGLLTTVELAVIVDRVEADLDDELDDDTDTDGGNHYIDDEQLGALVTDDGVPLAHLEKVDGVYRRRAEYDSPEVVAIRVELADMLGLEFASLDDLHDGPRVLDDTHIDRLLKLTRQRIAAAAELDAVVVELAELLDVDPDESEPVLGDMLAELRLRLRAAKPATMAGVSAGFPACDPSHVQAFVHRGRLLVGARTVSAVNALESLLPAATWPRDVDGTVYCATGVQVSESALQFDDDPPAVRSARPTPRRLRGVSP